MRIGLKCQQQNNTPSFLNQFKAMEKKNGQWEMTKRKAITNSNPSRYCNVAFEGMDYTLFKK